MRESATDDPWADLVPAFVDGHYGSLRGRVRTAVIHEQLGWHVGAPPQRVVDIGGGAGNQSIPLARAGHEVTIVDPSPAMLARAAQCLETEENAVAARVHLVQAAGEDAPAALAGAVSDVVLCHGVLLYLDDPEPMVDALCHLVAPEGLLSIVAKNSAAMALRHAQEGDWAGVIAAFDADRQVNELGVVTRGDRVEHLADLIERREVEPVDWYGVRLFTDCWMDPSAPTDPEDLVVEAELLASQRDPYRQLSRLFHLVGRRAG